MTTRALPEDPGTVIGWTISIDGVRSYGAALVERDDETDDLVWWRFGYREAWSPEQLAETLGAIPWQIVGKVHFPCQYHAFTFEGPCMRCGEPFPKQALQDASSSLVATSSKVEDE